MEELFGISMNSIMVALSAIFLAGMAAVVVMGWRNRVMVKLGLRNIPRRRAQTVLIIVGVMLSTVIIAAAFGTGDTISFSIRKATIDSLRNIDEIMLSTRVDASDSFGSPAYVPMGRFAALEADLSGLDIIDGMTPQVAETVPAQNPRTSLSEGQMRVVGLDTSRLAGFKPLALASSSQEVSLLDLASNEVFINEKAAKELEAVAQDEVRVVLEEGPQFFTVRGIVEDGGLAGRDPTIIMPMERAQALFDRPGELNVIVVSNKGDERSGADLSKEVARELRIFFADREVVGQLKVLLAQDSVLAQLQELEKDKDRIDGDARDDLGALIGQLQRTGTSDELIALLSDPEVSGNVLDALGGEEFSDIEVEASTLFDDIGEFSVLEIKRFLLGQADEAGSFVTSFFIIMGMFSIMVGILLIFLIFVMLAASRRSEMGMARAIGAKRSHLVQMFVFEGTAYAVVSAAVGVAVGLLVSSLIIFIANRIFESVAEDFSFVRHFELRSAIVAYCLGMVITFATIAFSAFRVSRLNIVAAVRGLPSPSTATSRGWRYAVQTFLPRVKNPFRFGWRMLLGLRHFNLVGQAGALANLLRTFRSILALPFAVLALLARLVLLPLKQGWLVLIAGVFLIVMGVGRWEHTAPFSIGVSLAVIGLGLILQTLLRRTSLREDRRDRIAFSFMGVFLLVFWLLPFDALESLTGELDSNIEMFFISGISMVGAAVWTVIYNADLILRALTLATSRFGKLRPVMVTAVAYPMSAKFRTGLTLAMFGLVIFTLIVMSVLTGSFGTAIADEDTVTGEWDIDASINFNTPIEDIEEAVAANPGLAIGDFQAMGGFTGFGVDARQVGVEEQRWEGYGVRAADDAFLASTKHKLKLIADGYGETSREAFDWLRSDPTLVVVDAFVVPSRSGGGFDEEGGFKLEGFYYDDETFKAVDIEIREPRTGEIRTFTVIGVLDQLTDAFGEIGGGMIGSKTVLDEALPFALPITTYRFRVAEGVDVAQAAKTLEASFQENGMETTVLTELLQEQADAQRAFNRLLTGFMGLGLMVGIASLGVISLRAVVERRQQIGVLRAIGYRKRMVQLSFLLESSFVALLGIGIGVGLGTILSYNLVTDIQKDVASIRFTVPWLQIGIIIAIAYVFSLVTTFLPARQASEIYPAEALRYE
ncbi:MAG: putative ABC transport system permease protein [Chloroflexi bacterium]|jgi:putative ABC transport system permease protein|nr:MAG: putative ABC transport system permease protein [Chloroflexota bacterium]